MKKLVYKFMSMFFACVFVLNLTSHYGISVNAESITLSSWLSYDALGEELIGAVATGEQVFVNYKLMNSSGNLVGREHDCPVQFRIYDPNGVLYDEYAYNYSDNDYLGFIPEESGIWSYEIETSNWVSIGVSGDIRVISNSVDMKTWVSNTAYGGTYTTFEKGDGAYVCCNLYETVSKEKLGNECEINVEISITTPNGDTVSDNSSDPYFYFGCYTDWYGTYSYTVEITGDYEATQSGTFECVKNDALDYNTDVWGFINSSENFTNNRINNYYINEEYWNYYIENHSQLIDISRAMIDMNEEWRGSCYGMSSIVTLIESGAMNSTEIPGSPSSVRSASKPINKLDVMSLINYYQLTQSDTVMLNYRAEFAKLTNEEKLRMIISYCTKYDDNGHPAIMGITYSEGGGHAVVAYGIETGSWWHGFKKYDTRIEIYDPNSFMDDVDLMMYINTNDFNWIIPGNGRTQDNANIALFTADTDLLNYNGCAGNKNKYAQYLLSSAGLQDGLNYAFNSIDYKSFQNVILSTNNYGSNFALTDQQPSTGTLTGIVTPNEITDYYIYSDCFSSGEAQNTNIVLPNLKSSYTMKLDEAENIDFSLRYEDFLYDVECENGSLVSCNSYGVVQVETNGADCSMQMISESDLENAIENNITVSCSDNGKCTLQKIKDGVYQFSGSNLSYVEVSVVSDYATGEYITSSISEPDYKELSITVDSENKKISLVVTDKKLTIELPTNSNLQGDVNLDGEFSVADIVMLQKWLLCAGSLSNWKNGDLCKDEIIDVFDLVLMKRALIENSKSQKEYWVIFEEGYREKRVELSKVYVPSDAKIIFDGKSLKVNQNVTCYQYYYDDATSNWVEIGTYDILTDYAYSILASNVDIYDESGNVVFVKNSDTYTDYLIT